MTFLEVVGLISIIFIFIVLIIILVIGLVHGFNDFDITSRW